MIMVKDVWIALVIAVAMSLAGCDKIYMDKELEGFSGADPVRGLIDGKEFTIPYDPASDSLSDLLMKLEGVGGQLRLLTLVRRGENRYGAPILQSDSFALEEGGKLSEEDAKFKIMPNDYFELETVPLSVDANRVMLNFGEFVKIDTNVWQYEKPIDFEGKLVPLLFYGDPVASPNLLSRVNETLDKIRNFNESLQEAVDHYLNVELANLVEQEDALFSVEGVRGYIGEDNKVRVFLFLNCSWDLEHELLAEVSRSGKIVKVVMEAL